MPDFTIDDPFKPTKNEFEIDDPFKPRERPSDRLARALLVQPEQPSIEEQPKTNWYVNQVKKNFEVLKEGAKAVPHTLLEGVKSFPTIVEYLGKTGQKYEEKYQGQRGWVDDLPGAQGLKPIQPAAIEEDPITMGARAARKKIEQWQEPFKPDIGSIGEIKSAHDFAKWATSNISNAATQVVETLLPGTLLGKVGKVKKAVDIAEKAPEALSATGKLLKYVADWAKVKPMDIPIGVLELGQTMGGQLDDLEKGKTKELSPVRALAGALIATKLEELGTEKLFAKYLKMGPEMEKFAAQSLLKRAAQGALTAGVGEGAEEFFQSYAEQFGIDPTDLLSKKQFFNALEGAAAGAIGGVALGGLGGSLVRERKSEKEKGEATDLSPEAVTILDSLKSELNAGNITGNDAIALKDSLEKKFPGIGARIDGLVKELSDKAVTDDVAPSGLSMDDVPYDITPARLPEDMEQRAKAPTDISPAMKPGEKGIIELGPSYEEFKQQFTARETGPLKEGNTPHQIIFQSLDKREEIPELFVSGYLNDGGIIPAGRTDLALLYPDKPWEPTVTEQKPNEKTNIVQQLIDEGKKQGEANGQFYKAIATRLITQTPQLSDIATLDKQSKASLLDELQKRLAMPGVSDANRKTISTLVEVIAGERQKTKGTKGLLETPTDIAPASLPQTGKTLGTPAQTVAPARMPEGTQTPLGVPANIAPARIPGHAAPFQSPVVPTEGFAPSRMPGQATERGPVPGIPQKEELRTPTVGIQDQAGKQPVKTTGITFGPVTNQPKRNQWVGEIEDVDGTYLGNIYKTGDNEWRIYKGQAETYGRGATEVSSPLTKEQFRKSAVDQTTVSGQTVRRYRLVGNGAQAGAPTGTQPAAPTFTVGEPVTFTNTRGDVIPGTVINVKGDTVRIRGTNGKVFTPKIERISKVSGTAVTTQPEVEKVQASKKGQETQPKSIFRLIQERGGISKASFDRDINDLGKGGFFIFTDKSPGKSGGASLDYMYRTLVEEGVITPNPNPELNNDDYLWNLIIEERQGKAVTIDRLNNFDKTLAEEEEQALQSLKEDLRNEGKTDEEINQILEEVGRDQEKEGHNQAVEQGLRAGQALIDESEGLIVPEEEEPEPEAAISAASTPTKAASTELFDTSDLFTLSGNQPIKQTTFTPPEKKGTDRLLDVEKQTTEELQDRLSGEKAKREYEEEEAASQETPPSKTQEPQDYSTKTTTELGKMGIDILIDIFGDERGSFSLEKIDENKFKIAYERLKPIFAELAKRAKEKAYDIRSYLAGAVASHPEGKIKDIYELAVDRYAEELKDNKEEANRENKPDKSPLLSGRDGLIPTRSQQIAAWVKDSLDKGTVITKDALHTKAAEVFGGTMAEGKYNGKDAFDALEMGINQYILGAVNNTRMNPAVSPVLARANTTLLQDRVMRRIPSQQGLRSEEQDEFQQFSTPPDLAYTMAWAADITENDTVLEPSAGIGGIAVFAKNAGAKVIVNELSARRAAILKDMGFDKVYTENAEQIHAILRKEVKPTVVLMNPPFSSTAGRIPGQRKSANVIAHLDQALKLLQPGGRMVALIGKGWFADPKAVTDYFTKLKQDYNLRAIITVDGKNYAKYGTTYDNRILVIDKTAPEGKPTLEASVDNVKDAIPLLKEIRDARTPITEQRTAESKGEEVSPTGEGTGRPVNAVLPSTGTVGNGKRPEGGLPGRGNVETNAPVESEQSDELAGTSKSERPKGTGKSPQGIKKSERTGEGDTQSASGLVSPEIGTEPPEPTLKIASKKAERVKKDFTDSIYESYQPQKLVIEGAKDHPGKLVESAAMAVVEPPDPTYSPKIPESIIKKGQLSLAQLEAIVYAGQAHQEMLTTPVLDNNKNPTGKFYRKGFFIGDGTGVGKGREIAGIILDNMNQGRKKAIWISKNAPLIKDAKRDVKGIGIDPALVIDVSKTKISSAIKESKGIAFVAYTLLKSEKKDSPEINRLNQLVKWFGEDYDGVIVFDEAHHMGNCLAVRGAMGTSTPSKMALAGVELQRRLPNARVVYVSATGATEVMNLAYADRLGLWGPGTPFTSKDQFVSQISAGGIAAMEFVARDMKALGNYIARSLSYEDVKYERLEHTLTPHQRDNYNLLADTWQMVLAKIDDALKVTGGANNARAVAAAKSAFWGSLQRFFNQVITSMQMPSVIKAMEKDIENGYAPVLQFVNTNEAAQTRALSKMEEGDELEDLDLSPMEILMQYVQNSFPVAKYQEIQDPTDPHRTIWVPVLDSNGNIVEDPDAVAERDALLDTLGSIKAAPEGPLEMVLNHFGTGKVAEVTGRRQRIVKDAKGNKIVEKRSPAKCMADVDAFLADEKQILMYSDAGGTGRSYDANLTVENQRLRRHYLVQPGWRANNAIQGFGRTHRSNQKQAPEYILVTTDIIGQKRFISSIARRLDQLGALTKGQRETGSGGFFTARDNLENQYAQDATDRLIMDIYQHRVPNWTMSDFIQQSGLTRLVDPRDGSLNVDAIPPVTQFLNRLLAMKLDKQAEIFELFSERMDANIRRSMELGTLDVGLETLRAENITKASEQVIHTDEKSGAQTKYVQLDVTQKAKKYSFDSIVNLWADSGFFRNVKSGQIWAASLPRTKTDARTGLLTTVHRLRGPKGTVHEVTNDDLHNREKYEPMSTREAKEVWDREFEALPDTFTYQEHFITGALLPIWDRLDQETARIMRVQTDDGERMIGRLISPHNLSETLRKIGATAATTTYTPENIFTNVKDHDFKVELANGWKIKRSKVQDEYRIEIKGPVNVHIDELKMQGVFVERVNYDTRFFIPTTKEGIDTIKGIIATKPIVNVIAPLSARENTNIVDTNDVNYKKIGNLFHGTPHDVSRFSTQYIGTDVGAFNAPVAKTPTYSVEQVEQFLALPLRRWSHAGKVKVIQSSKELPVRFMAATQENEPILGAYDIETDTTYIIADNIGSRRAAIITLVHEVVGHRGIMALIGNWNDFNSIMEQIAATYRGPLMDKIVRAYGLDMTNDRDRGIAAAELIAHMAETRENTPLLHRILGIIRAGLRKIFPGMKWTNTDILRLVDRSRNMLGVKPQKGTGTYFKKGVDTTTDAQGTWNPKDNRILFKKTLDDDAAKKLIHDLLAEIKKQPDFKEAVNALSNANMETTVKAGKGLMASFHERFGKPYDDKDYTLFDRAFNLPYWIAKKHESMRQHVAVEMRAKEQREKMLFDWYEGGLRDAQDSVIKAGKEKEFQDLVWKWDRKHFPKGTVTEERFQGSFDDGTIAINPRRGEQIRDFLLSEGVSPEVAECYVKVREILDNVLLEYWELMQQYGVPENDIAEYRKQIGDIPNYFPHVREGNTYVAIYNKDGDTVYREHFDRMKEQYLTKTENKAPARAKAWLEAQIKAGKMEGKASDYRIEGPKKVAELPDEVFFQIPVEAMDQILDVAAGKVQKETGADLKQALAQAVADTLKARGWARHAIARKGTPGFKQDNVFDTLFEHLSGFAGFKTKMERAKEHSEILRSIDAKENPEEYTYNSKYVKDVLANQDRIDRFVDGLRGIFFTKYLGAVVKSGVVNLTQNMALAAPVLSVHTKNADGKLIKAMVDVRKALTSKAAWTQKEVKYPTLSDDEQWALHQLVESGDVADAYLRELAGELPGSGLAKHMHKALSRAGIFMSLAEKFNRTSTGLAAFRVAMNEKRMSREDALEFAREIIYDSHFLLGKSNLPELMRGGTIQKGMRSAYTFRTFSHNFALCLVNLWTNQGKQGKYAVLRSMRNLFLMGGITAVPMGNMILRAIMTVLGDDDDDPLTKLRSLMPWTWLKDLVIYGLPGIAGIDISGSLSMEVPTSWSDILGVPWAIIEDTGNMVKSWQSGQHLRALSETPFTPTAIRNAIQAYILATTGQVSRTGKPINYFGEVGPRKISATEAVLKGVFGFQPVSSSNAFRAHEATRELEETVQARKSRYANQYVNALISGDHAGMLSVIQEVVRWNQDHVGKPHMMIDLEDSIKWRLRQNSEVPKQMRGEVLGIAREWSGIIR